MPLFNKRFLFFSSGARLKAAHGGARCVSHTRPLRIRLSTAAITRVRERSNHEPCVSSIGGAT
jgi:hypothetical protein